MPIGTEKSALLAAAADGAVSNYFGDGSDGSVTTSSDVTHTVQNKSGSFDGDMVVLQYSQLTISSGDTMTVDQPCRGLFIYVTGNCTIAGTLTMTGKGGFSDPTTSGGSDTSAVSSTGLRLPMGTATGTDTLAAADFAGAGNAIVAAVSNQAGISGNGTIFKISRDGGAAVGGHTRSGSGGGGSDPGTPGTDGATGAATISTGGGGSGALNFAHNADSGQTARSGGGGIGGCFGGGSGGGGCEVKWGSATASAGVSYGGSGGAGAQYSGAQAAGGGAGNPGGSAANGGGSYTATAGSSGTGGLIWLVVGGDLTISGTISSRGTAGGTISGPASVRAGGGSSGSGAIMILHGGTFSNTGTIDVSEVGDNTSSSYNWGGQGGTGGKHNAQVNKA